MGNKNSYDNVSFQNEVDRVGEIVNTNETLWPYAKCNLYEKGSDLRCNLNIFSGPNKSSYTIYGIKLERNCNNYVLLTEKNGINYKYYIVDLYDEKNLHIKELALNARVSNLYLDRLKNVSYMHDNIYIIWTETFITTINLTTFEERCYSSMDELKYHEPYLKEKSQKRQKISLANVIYDNGTASVHYSTE